MLEWIELIQPESHILAFVPETSVYVTNMLIIMHPLPKLPLLYYGNGDDISTTMQIWAIWQSMHIGKHKKLSGITFAMLGDTDCGAQSTRAQLLMLHFRKLSGFLCKIFTAD